jgi:ABC-type Fe3+-hydroxamate transport system substrate-binding protein
MELVGQAVDAEDAAEALIHSMRERIDVVKARLGGVDHHPKVFYGLDATDPAKPFTKLGGGCPVLWPGMNPLLA